MSKINKKKCIHKSNNHIWTHTHTHTHTHTKPPPLPPPLSRTLLLLIQSPLGQTVSLNRPHNIWININPIDPKWALVHSLSLTHSSKREKFRNKNWIHWIIWTNQASNLILSFPFYHCFPSRLSSYLTNLYDHFLCALLIFILTHNSFHFYSFSWKKYIWHQNNQASKKYIDTKFEVSIISLSFSFFSYKSPRCLLFFFFLFLFFFFHFNTIPVLKA